MGTDPTFAEMLDREPLEHTILLLREARDEILADWVERVRKNTSVRTGQALSEPLLLNHVPQLLDSMADRLEVNHSREETEQWAAIHGFTRRISGYDVAETVMELCMLRRAIWAQVGMLGAPAAGLLAAMERIDGMLDRAIITGLQAFLDPAAQMLIRRSADTGQSISIPDEAPAADTAAGGNPAS